MIHLKSRKRRVPPCGLRRLAGPFLAVILLAAIALANGLPGQNTPGSAQEPRKEFYHDFRGSQPLHPSLRLIGPDAVDVSRPEAEGLRITLPANRPVNHPVEVVTAFSVSGDFEITGTYHLLSASQPAKGYGVGVALNIADNDARNKFAKVARSMVVKDGSVFQSEFWIKAPTRDYQWRKKPTDSRIGQLRLVRVGASLQFLAADGLEGNFEEIYSRPFFGTEDLAHIHFVVADSGSPGNAVDARLVDLRIRSSSPLPEPAPGTTSALDEASASLPTGWLTAIAVIGLLVVATFSVMAWLFYGRQRGARLP